MISRNRTESQKGIRLSGGKCIICNWCGKNYKNEPLVVGAHVRPFEAGAEFDMANNIIALCPNHHAEYDGFAFTIDVKTKRILCSDKSNPIDGMSVEEKVRHIDNKNLAYHQYLFNQYNKIW